MLLYTPLPLELVLQGIENQPRYAEIKLGRLLVTVEEMGFNRARIISITSTNPADYLDPRFQPGTYWR
ncbi:MAG: YlzJ-like family protein [Clostridia bacterium]|nr:YlzJ-like family protein [Clostridia bacterium]